MTPVYYPDLENEKRPIFSIFRRRYEIGMLRLQGVMKNVGNLE